MVMSQLPRVLPRAQIVDLCLTVCDLLAFGWLLRMLWRVGLRVLPPMLRQSHP
jgi:hypothetical protein